jgi:LuxR family transcriptional regulator, quorum-sensing system regulator BjaR1
VKLGETIDGLEAASDIVQLQEKMQLAIGLFGFSSYNFFDAGKAHLSNPYYFGTTGEAWESDYKANQFVSHDHVLSFARRTNTAFRWSDVPLPVQIGKRKPLGLKLLEAASDHGFSDGYILPFHFVDDQGRTHSTLVALFWSDDAAKLSHSLSRERKYELELIMLYFVQRATELRKSELEKRNSFRSAPTAFSHLTDRERDALSWAGRGRTVDETSEILGISQLTVKTYLKQAMEKLEASNKTHAVAKAVHLGLIDL